MPRAFGIIFEMRQTTWPAVGAIVALALGACTPSAPIATDSPGPATPRAATTAAGSPAHTATVTPSPTPQPTPTPAIPPSVVCEWTEVAGVDDGDTFRITTAGGENDRVRLIGIDAPEGGKALSVEATAALTAALGARVCLETDTTNRDRFGRLLRYAWTADGSLVNEALLAAGLARVTTFPPDTRYLDSRYQPAEDRAKGAGLGLWGLATPAAPPRSSPATTEPAATTAPAEGECDPAYPDVCIPPVSSAGDLDCADVPFRRFRVLPPDPHRFDGDKNGIGCEGS